MQDLTWHCFDLTPNDLSICSHVFTLKISLDFIHPRGQVSMVQRPTGQTAVTSMALAWFSLSGPDHQLSSCCREITAALTLGWVINDMNELDSLVGLLHFSLSHWSDQIWPAVFLIITWKVNNLEEQMWMYTVHYTHTQYTGQSSVWKSFH